MSCKKYEIVPKEKNYGEWYKSILTTSDMIDYSDVRGCYVLKHLAMELWEEIKYHLDTSIRNLGVDNCYFPLFVTKSNLEKESSHFSDFTPEVAWIMTEDPVIQQKLSLCPDLKINEINDVDKIKNSDEIEIEEAIRTLQSKGLEVHVRTKTSERYAIRPTSETIIYPHFANWIKKGPYPKINQWANIVRWENKATQPFIRSREFLWQEGHTCHPDKSSAIKEMNDVLQIYKNLYERILAVPMIDGYKTKSETFPGAELTATIEGFLPDSGKGIQSATSHYLGQKFSKIFNIKDSNGEFVHQNSWGLTTRSIGIMIMTHSDNKGLVLPPNVAPIQVVLIACGLNSKTTEIEKQSVLLSLRTLRDHLIENNIKAIFDEENESPGMKFNKWEVRGVPLRIEFGPKNIANDTVVFVRRDKPPKTKYTHTFSQINHVYIKDYLSEISNDMFVNAREKMRQNIVYCKSNIDIVVVLKQKKLALIDWKDDINNDNDDIEQSLKQMCKDHNINSTKILCIPIRSTLDNIGIRNSTGDVLPYDQKYALFGRSY